jgi:GntR family transcriptional regulator
MIRFAEEVRCQMTDDGVKPIKTKVSLPDQAREYLLGLIEDGTYDPGEQLPSENELATQLGISRPTLREALLNLEGENVVVRKHGVGTFVAPGYVRQLESGLECLESLLELASKQGARVQVSDLRVELEPADADVADRLKVPAGTLVTGVRRVLVLEGAPVAYMVDAALPETLAPDSVDEAFQGSVLDLLRQQHRLEISQAVANIVATNAGALLASRLQVQPEQALLLLEETLFDDQGKAVEFSKNYFVPDYFRFHVVRR